VLARAALQKWAFGISPFGRFTQRRLSCFFHLKHGDELLLRNADPVPVGGVDDVDDGVGVGVVATPIGPEIKLDFRFLVPAMFLEAFRFDLT